MRQEREVLQRQGAEEERGVHYYGRRTLFPGRGRNDSFAPTIVMRRAAGVLQRGRPGFSSTKREDCSKQTSVEGLVV